MPYGVDKDMGGDNPSNTKFMEDCVSKISGTNKRTGKPYTKSEKIAICKTSLKRKGESSTENVADPISIAEIETIKANYLKKLMTMGHNISEAEQLTEKFFAKANYEKEKLEFIFYII